MMNQKSIPILYKSKEDCCGCTACFSICPQRAIEMVDDEEGFLYPRINPNVCILCGKCLTVCSWKTV